MKMVLAVFFLLFSSVSMAALAIQRPSVPPGLMHIDSDAKTDTYLRTTSLAEHHEYLVAQVIQNFKERQEWEEKSADGYLSVINFLFINCTNKTYANNVAIVFFTQPFGTGEVVFAMDRSDEPDSWFDDFQKADRGTDLKLVNTACDLYQASRKK